METYEQKLKLAKEALESGSYDKETIEYIFPELKESEDEIHRKWILEYLYDGLRKSDEQFKEQFKSAIDWLGKQKEQKPAQINDEKEYIRTIKGIISDFIRDKKPEDVTYYQRIYDWLDGRHVEQKPAEWSGADNIGWDEAFVCVTRAEKAAKNEEELQNAVTAEKWLKEIKFKYYVNPAKQE